MPVAKFVTTLLICFSLFVLPGCGGPVPEQVDPDLGIQTLENTLDQWKEGATPDSLSSGTPEVIVQDTDWSSGFVLVDYETIDPGEAIDANLRVQVKLSLQDANKKSVEKVVTYVVTTSPKLTVFRDMFN